MVHKVQHSQHILVFNALQIKKWVRVRISLQHRSKERAAGRQNYFVRLQLVSLTGECHVEKVFVVPQLPERGAHIALELVPLEAELFSTSRASPSRHLDREPQFLSDLSATTFC